MTGPKQQAQEFLERLRLAALACGYDWRGGGFERFLAREVEPLFVRIAELEHELGQAHGVAQACERRAEQAEARADALEAALEEWQLRAAEAEARVKELEAELQEERACHDCREYRQLMEAKLREAEQDNALMHAAVANDNVRIRDERALADRLGSAGSVLHDIMQAMPHWPNEEIATLAARASIIWESALAALAARKEGKP